LILYDIPADLVGTDDRLTNWGTWAREGNGGAGRARSIESRYRRPAGEEDPRRTPRPVVDGIDAQLVDRALAPAAGMPWRESRVLRAHYAYQADPRATCRQIGQHWSRYREELIRALWIARNRLRQRDLATGRHPVHTAPTNSDYRESVTGLPDGRPSRTQSPQASSRGLFALQART